LFHDLKRTSASRGYRSGMGLPDISKRLGHTSIKTTERYLNIKLGASGQIKKFEEYSRKFRNSVQDGAKYGTKLSVINT